MYPPSPGEYPLTPLVLGNCYPNKLFKNFFKKKYDIIKMRLIKIFSKKNMIL
jgi:hypothetical protein